LQSKPVEPDWAQVFLNREKLPIKNFMEYVELYLPDKSLPRIHEKVNVVAATPGQFQQVRPCTFPEA
jgi:hypothetical protein